LHVGILRLFRDHYCDEAVCRRRNRRNIGETGKQLIRSLCDISFGLLDVQTTDIRIDIGSSIDFAALNAVPEDAIAWAHHCLAKRTVSKAYARSEVMRLRVCWISPSTVTVNAVPVRSDSVGGQSFVSYAQPSKWIRDVTPSEMVVSLVGNRPEIPAKSE